ncbi:ribonuclease HIII [Virgibacillus oceani]
MATEVHIFSMDTIQEMKRYYHEEITTTPQGALFQAKTKNAVVTAYKSGKVMFQGKSPSQELQQWEGKMQSAIKTAKSVVNKKSAHSYAPPETLFAQSHIGTDEAGTGDYFGPITVSGVFVRKEQISKLRTLGVKDSKNLSDPAIMELSKEIVKEKIPYALLILHNDKYNELQAKGWSQGKMKAMLHQHVISKLLQKIGDAKMDGILIDQFCEPGIFIKHIKSERQTLFDHTYFMTKAESYSIAVAAASIIARARFVQEMDTLSERLDIHLPKGASKKVDRTIAQIIKVKGKDTLNSYAKLHFANTTKAQQYL